jgi:hypothetical protein
MIEFWWIEAEIRLAERRKNMSSSKHEQERLLDLYSGYLRAANSCAELAEQFGEAGEVYEVCEPGIRGIVRPDAGECRVAHEALLSCFSELMWESERYLEELRTRWPELREEDGGTLPPTWAEFIEKLHRDHPRLRAVENESNRSDTAGSDSGSAVAMPSLDFDDDEDDEVL